jgi:voltage-gated potassium channel Kch
MAQNRGVVVLVVLGDIEWGDTLMAAAIACGVFIVSYWFIYPRQRASTRGSGAMSCGACGYPTRGLDTTQCPECGANYLEVGVLPKDDALHRFDKPSLMYAAIISVGLFCFLAAIWH